MSKQPKYSISLSAEDVEGLRNIIDDPKTSKTRRIKAELLLDLDGKRANYAVVECLSSMYGVSIPLIYHLMERFGREGIQAVKKSPNSTPRRNYKMTPEIVDKILSWVKMPPPNGRRRWSAYLIADLLEFEGVTNKISYQTVYRILEKYGIKL